MEYAAHQWGLIAKMHEKDLHDLEEHALALRNILPDVPLSPHEKNRIDNLPTSTTRISRPLFNQPAPSTTKAPVNIREASRLGKLYTPWTMTYVTQQSTSPP